MLLLFNGHYLLHLHRSGYNYCFYLLPISAVPILTAALTLLPAETDIILIFLLSVLLFQNLHFPPNFLRRFTVYLYSCVVGCAGVSLVLPPLSLFQPLLLFPFYRCFRCLLVVVAIIFLPLSSDILVIIPGRLWFSPISAL